MTYVYGSIIKQVFPEYGIPYFIMKKKPVIQNPIVTWYLVACNRSGFPKRMYSSCSKPACGLTREEVELLENYCLEYGIKGRRWKHFELGEPEYSLEELNTYREQFINPFIKLESQLKKSDDIHGMITALYAHLEEISLQKQLEDWVDELKEVGRLEQAEENAQIWNIVISTFDQMVEILGDQKVSLDECYEFWNLVFFLKPALFLLLWIRFGRKRTAVKEPTCKALFVLGLNDGVLPASSRDEGCWLPMKGIF